MMVAAAPEFLGFSSLTPPLPYQPTPVGHPGVAADDGVPTRVANAAAPPPPPQHQRPVGCPYRAAGCCPDSCRYHRRPPLSRCHRLGSSHLAPAVTVKVASALSVPLLSALVGGVITLVFLAHVPPVATAAAPDQPKQLRPSKKGAHIRPHHHAADKDAAKKHHHLYVSTLRGHTDCVT